MHSEGFYGTEKDIPVLKTSLENRRRTYGREMCMDKSKVMDSW